MKERQINAMMSSRASSLLRKASGGFEPSATDRTRTRAAIARRVAVGVAAGAAVAAGAKSAAAAPSLAPAALAPAVLAPAAATTTIAPTAVTTFAGVGFATKFVAAMAIVGTVSAGAVTVRHVTRPIASPSTQATTQNAASNATTTTQTIAANPIAAPVQAAPIAVVDLPAEQPTTQPIAQPIALATPVAIADPPQNTAKHSAAAANSKTAALQIGAENELLRGAQIAIQCDEYSKALGLLSEHAQRFPNGALSEERDAARVLALCGAGRQIEAAKMGAAFLSAHPDSMQASRIRSSCANGVTNTDAPAQ